MTERADRRRARRPARPATAERLEKSALAYLEKFDSSAETLRRVLRRRVERAVRAGVGDRVDGLALVEATVAKMLRLGFVDDRRFAETKAASLHRAGRSARAIRLTLASKGIAPEQIDEALAARGADGDRAELEAALALARRRRLGPFRPPEERAEARARDLAAMGRAGFSYPLARRIILAPRADELEAEIAG
jgi:regulatory protein